MSISRLNSSTSQAANQPVALATGKTDAPAAIGGDANQTRSSMGHVAMLLDTAGKHHAKNDVEAARKDLRTALRASTTSEQALAVYEQARKLMNKGIGENPMYAPELKAAVQAAAKLAKTPAELLKADDRLLSGIGPDWLRPERTQLNSRLLELSGTTAEIITALGPDMRFGKMEIDKGLVAEKLGEALKQAESRNEAQQISVFALAYAALSKKEGEPVLEKQFKALRAEAKDACSTLNDPLSDKIARFWPF